ncbi:MAG: ABC transporter permease [Anaerolinea sp.]|jgi:ribose transport system permease protein|nr:ABC transporter permease [Anaerolinea sp.]
MIERLRSYGIVAVFCVLFLLLAITSRSFFSFANAANIMDQSAILLIFAATTTILIVAGVFDLSIAAVATASAILTVIAVNVLGPVAGVLAGIAFGALLGLVTGLAITATGVNSFIGTLAASFTYRGLGLILASGGLVTIESQAAAEALQRISVGTYLGLKGIVWIALAFVLVMEVLLAFTIFGRMVYAVGGNRRAAFLAGIRTKRVLVACYTLSGLGAGVAGVLYVAQYGSGATNAYSDTFAFTAIAATVVGGVSIFGGSGSVWRGSLGILTFALIGNGLNLLGVDTTYQLTILGLLIFLAVAADQVFRRSERV